MHYEDGTEAKLGDIVHVKLKEGQSGREFIGVLVSGTTTSNTCNGQIVPTLARDVSALGTSQWAAINPPTYPHCFTIGEARKIA